MTTKASLDNETLARQICLHREWSGSKFAVGSFVAIAEGIVVGVGNTYEQADAHLVAAGLQPGEGLICEVAELETEIVRRVPPVAVAQFPFFQGLPTVLLSFEPAKPEPAVVKRLLVDSGFTGKSSLVLSKADAAKLRQRSATSSQVAGALVGAHQRVWVRCSIPAVGFTANLMAISSDLSALSLPDEIDGLVGLSFLNHFQWWGAERLEERWVFALEMGQPS